MSKPTRRQQPSPTSVQRAANPRQTRTPQAPPPYRPQATPKCLQPKAATPQRPPPAAQARATPAPPAAYRPQPTPKVLQRKEAGGRAPQVRPPQSKPAPPPTYTPVPKKVIQAKLVSQPSGGPASPPAYRPERSPQTKLKSSVSRPPPGSALANRVAVVQRMEHINNGPEAGDVFVDFEGEKHEIDQIVEQYHNYGKFYLVSGEGAGDFFTTKDETRLKQHPKIVGAIESRLSASDPTALLRNVNKKDAQAMASTIYSIADLMSRTSRGTRNVPSDPAVVTSYRNALKEGNKIGVNESDTRLSSARDHWQTFKIKYATRCGWVFNIKYIGQQGDTGMRRLMTIDEQMNAVFLNDNCANSTGSSIKNFAAWLYHQDEHTWNAISPQREEENCQCTIL